MCDPDVEKDLCCMFERYVVLAAAGKKLTAAEKKVATEKAIGMLLKDSLGDKFKKINESSVFPIHKDKTKGSSSFNKVHLEKFCCVDYFADLAACRIERDEKCKRPARDDERVQSEAHDLMMKVAEKAKEDHTGKRASASGTAASVTDRLTDASKYTGSSKERFDESGQGKGIEGRVYRVEHTGYVGQYKGQGSFAK
ncbi:uncharacterized protein LOC121378710 [Gigantopelta aegis]|uniref:uncharacterized protein LOC121378710 n=1 Tax=Gigantopelta aegis TaxID=1735272 RepID=UPI001B88D20E|nr:uncharacterized protein LOC121378710 [Gigantopelta aegis]